eukprot:Platyproteum_vivax@DN10628_c0_g1_i1.p1
MKNHTRTNSGNVFNRRSSFGRSATDYLSALSTPQGGQVVSQPVLPQETYIDTQTGSHMLQTPAAHIYVQNAATSSNETSLNQDNRRKRPSIWMRIAKSRVTHLFLIFGLVLGSSIVFSYWQHRRRLQQLEMQVESNGVLKALNHMGETAAKLTSFLF